MSSKTEMIEIKPTNVEESPASTAADATISNIEIAEIKDIIMPLESRSDSSSAFEGRENKAFELEDIDFEKNPTKNYFNRQERPGTMMSMTSMNSKTSRSSINCATGYVKCPNLRLKKFFSYNKEDGGFFKACQEIRPMILPEKDGQLVGTWLLTEINHWDLHRERIVMLSEKTLFIISYNFISMKILDYRRLNLSELKGVSVGDLKYPSSSFMEPYLYGAVKLEWPDNAYMVQKLNPFSSNLPEVVLTSHHILYNEKEKETETYNCDEFIASLETVISKMNDAEKTIEIKECPIEIKSYASVISVLYNQNWLGYNLDRNGVKF